MSIVKKKRLFAGMSQEDLAVEINKLTDKKINLTQQQISNIEREISLPNIKTAFAFAEILNTDIKTLFYKKEWFKNN